MDYERLDGFELPNGVQITAVACSSVFCIIGTSAGGLQVIPIDPKVGRGFSIQRFHSAITSISIDASSDSLCFVSGPSGHLVVVENLLSATPAVTELPKVDWRQCPLNAIAIAPSYSSESKRMVIGGASGDLVVVSRDVPPLFAISKTNSKGPVTCIEWREDLLVWTGPEFGLKAVNTKSSQRIVHMDFTSKSVNLVYLGNSRFCVTAGFRVSVVQFVRKQSFDVCQVVLAMELPADQFAPNNDLGRLLAGRERLAGFGLFDDSELSLTMVTVDGTRVTHHVIDADKRDIPFSDLVPLSSDCDEVVTAFSAGASPFMVIGAGSHVTVVSKRSVSSNALWMIDQGLFEQALEFSKLSDLSVQEYIASRAVSPLIDSHAYSRAIGLAPKLRLAGQPQWSSFIDKFISLPTGEHLQASLHALVPVIPYPPRDELTLSKSDYAKVVESLLRNVDLSFCDLLEAVRRWPVAVYPAASLIDSLIDLVPEDFTLDKAAKLAFIPTSSVMFPSGSVGTDDAHLRTIALMLCLKSLYDQSDKIEDSMDILIRLGCVDEIVQVLNTRVASNAAVRSWFEVNMLSLFVSDAHAVSQFVMKHPLLFPTESVIAELESHPFFLHVYLRELFFSDPVATKAFHGKQVDLFLQFDRDLLTEFLNQADGYDPAAALAAVRKARSVRTQLVEAEALLMWKSGNHKEAVELLIDVSQDVKMAVKFAASVQDRDLWDSIVTRIRSRDTNLLVDYIEGLMESDSVPDFASPENVLLTLAADKMTPRLLSVVARVMMRQKLKADIDIGCKAIVASDWENLRVNTRELDKAMSVFPGKSLCRVCSCSIVCPPPGDDFNDALPDAVAASIPLHVRTRAVLSVISDGQLVHSRCLSRTLMENTIFST